MCYPTRTCFFWPYYSSVVIMRVLLAVLFLLNIAPEATNAKPKPEPWHRGWGWVNPIPVMHVFWEHFDMNPLPKPQ